MESGQLGRDKTEMMEANIIYFTVIITPKKTDYLVYGVWLRRKEITNDTSFDGARWGKNNLALKDAKVNDPSIQWKM